MYYIHSILKELTGEYEARKSKYDQINAGFESNRSQLESVGIHYLFEIV